MTGAFGQTNYTISKAAIQGFTLSLCKGVSKYGVAANCIAPGFIKSAMSDNMSEEAIKAGIALNVVRRLPPEDNEIRLSVPGFKRGQFCQ